MLSMQEIIYFFKHTASRKNNCDDSPPQDYLVGQIFENGLLQVIPERILSLRKQAFDS